MHSILPGHLVLYGQDAWVVKVDEFGCEIANCNVGIQELMNDEGLKIYPNPANEYSTVEINISEENKTGAFTIYNLLGTEVYKQQVKNKAVLTIDTKVFNNGIYLYVLKTEDEIMEQKKVIISK